MIDSFNDPILDMAVENQLRWNYNTLFRDCRIEPMIDSFRVYGLNIEFDYIYLNAEKSILLDLGREVEIEFRCTKYESMEINKLSEALLDRYKDLANSLNFDSGIKSLEGESSGYLGDRLGSGKSDKTLWEYYLLESLRHIETCLPHQPKSGSVPHTFRMRKTRIGFVIRGLINWKKRRTIGSIDCYSLAFSQD